MHSTITASALLERVFMQIVLSAEITAPTAQGGVVPFELTPDGINFEEMEHALILKTMQRADWVIGKAAPILGLSYKTLQYRLDKHGIEKPERKGR